MSDFGLDSAVLFTPGRASYVTTAPDGGFEHHLTAASQHRAEFAAYVYDSSFHTSALFAGGSPTLAQNWPPEHIPPVGSREADKLAVPLAQRLHISGLSDEAIDTIIHRQGESNNSIGDVVHSMRAGYLNIDDFHRDGVVHGINLISGFMHGIRFQRILSVALDIPKDRIRRAPMFDTYGTPAAEFRPAESKAKAMATEAAAIAVNELVFRGVKRGDIDALAEAEERFANFASKKKRD